MKLFIFFAIFNITMATNPDKVRMDFKKKLSEAPCLPQNFRLAMIQCSSSVMQIDDWYDYNQFGVCVMKNMAAGDARSLAKKTINASSLNEAQKSDAIAKFYQCIAGEMEPIAMVGCTIEAVMTNGCNPNLNSPPDN